MPNNKKSENRKKKEINGFTIFLDDKHKEYLRKNLPIAKADLVSFARAEWNNLSEEDRVSFNKRARAEKDRLLKDDRLKNDSFGRCIADLKAEEAAKRKEIERRTKKAESIVEQALVAGNYATKRFVILRFGLLCTTSDDPPKYVPCEVGAVKFSLKEGIVQCYHTFINPGELPLGYAADIKKNAEATHQLTMAEVRRYDQYMGFKLNLMRIVENPDGTHDPFFVLPDHLPAALSILDFICQRGKVHHNEINPFDVLDLHVLLINLVRKGPSYLESVGKPAENWVYAPNLLLDKLLQSKFDYELKTSCPFHEEKETPLYCALGHVVHRALIVCNLITPKLGLPLLPRKHEPPITAGKNAAAAAAGGAGAAPAPEKQTRFAGKTQVYQEPKEVPAWFEALNDDHDEKTTITSYPPSTIGKDYDVDEDLGADEEEDGAHARPEVGDDDARWSTVSKSRNRVQDPWTGGLKKALPRKFP